jgi:ABC-2 type transport system permease protein
MDYVVPGLWGPGHKSIGENTLSNQISPIYFDSAVKQKRLLRELKELVQYKDLIVQMTIRNITVRYKRSLLGVIWTLLEPLMTMLVMAMVFSYILQRAIPNFAVYLLTALVVWGYFQSSTNSAMRDFSTGERLVSRVYLPQSIFIIVAIATGLVNFLLEFIAVLAIVFITGVSLPLYSVTLILPLFILTIFNLGLGLILAPLSAFFSDISNIYNILLRLLMYLSAIFYSIDIMPDWLQKIVSLNPVYQFIHIFRSPIYYSVPIPLDALGYVSLWALGLFVLGVLIFMRLSDDIISRS